MSDSEIDKLATKTFRDLEDIAKPDHAPSLTFADVIEDVRIAQTSLKDGRFEQYKQKLNDMIDHSDMAQIHIIAVDSKDGKLWTDIPSIGARGRYNACSWIDAIIPYGATEPKPLKVPPCQEDTNLKKP